MKNIIKRTLSILTGRERRSFFLLMAGNVLISIADIAFLAMLIFLAGFYTRTAAVSRLPAYVPRSWMDPASMYPALVFLLLFILKNTGAYIAGYAQYRFVYKVALRIAGSNLLCYLEGPYMEYAGTDSAEHIRKISQQPIEFCHYVLTGQLQILTELILIVLTIAAVMWYDAKLFLLLLLILLPAVFALSYFGKKKLRSARTHIKTSGEKTLQHLREALSGYIESNIYDRKIFFHNRYIRYQRLLNKYLSDLRIIQGLPSRFIEIFAVAGFFVLVVIHHFSGNESTISLVTIGAFTVAVYKVIPGIAKILSTVGQIHAYEFSLHGLLGRRGSAEGNNPGAEQVAPIRSVAFHDVSFCYPQGQSRLRHFNLDVHRGDMTGITGASGKGKTTILHLLMGFLEPDEGAILINHESTDAAARQRYRKHIAYSRQQSFLIHDSILKNITLSESPVQEQELSAAIEATGLQELLTRLPEGLHHRITENGKNISGGQQKRISIARALYKKADLIILDEPFNELDEASARHILHHLQKLALQGKMIILITHDKKNLSYCNKVISLDVPETTYAGHSYTGVPGE